MTERTPKPDSKRNDPWPVAAQQLARLAAQRGKQFGSAEQLQQLDAVCGTISALCDTHPSPAAVKSHKLLQLLGTVLSKVLDQGNHRKWRQAAYAARVCCLMQALHMVLCMAGIEPGSGAPSVVATCVSSQLSESGLLPKLAVAVQEVAVVLTAANKKGVDAAATASHQDQHISAGAQLPATMLLFLVGVLGCWPGGALSSAAAAPLAAPAAQLAHAAVNIIQQRWEASSGAQQQQLQQQVAVQQELSACVMLSDLLMRLLHDAACEKMEKQPHSLQLLQAPQYHQLLLLLLVVHSQRLPQHVADNSPSSSSASLNISLPVTAIAGNASSSNSSSGSGSSSSGSGQQTMQQQLANSLTAAGQKQQLPYQLQLWQSLGLPQQLLGVACAALSPSEPCEDLSSTCRVLAICVGELICPNMLIASHDELLPSQMAVVRLHQAVPMLLLPAAAAFISNTSLVDSCATAAAASVNCWRLVQDEQLAQKKDVQGQSNSATQGASIMAAQLPMQELQQLVLQLLQQLMQQPEAAAKPPLPPQKAKKASSRSQHIAEQQQQPGGSTDVTHMLALIRVLVALLQLRPPVEFNLSWQGVSAVLQTFARNLLSCSSSKDMVITKQRADVPSAAHQFYQSISFLFIPYHTGSGSQEPEQLQLVRAAAAAAAGGAEQLQLFGLLLSTLKLLHAHTLHRIGARGEEVLPSWDSVRYVRNLGLAAHQVLAGLAPAAAGAPAAGSSAAGVGVLQPAAVPWLVLQARCLHLAGALLHKQAAWTPEGGADGPAPCGWNNAGYAADVVLPGVAENVQGAAAVASRLAEYIISSCCFPAGGSSNTSNEQASSGQASSRQTGNTQEGDAAATSASCDSMQQADAPAAAAGMPVPLGSELEQCLQQLQQELLPALVQRGEALAKDAAAFKTPFGTQKKQTTTQSDTRALDLLLQEPGHSSLQVLSGQLTALGAVLCTLPTPWCCNSPGCTNMAMPSEQQLVGGKRCICAGCQVARYCGKECQTAHWKQHRPVCRRISKR